MARFRTIFKDSIDAFLTLLVVASGTPFRMILHDADLNGIPNHIFTWNQHIRVVNKHGFSVDFNVKMGGLKW